MAAVQQGKMEQAGGVVNGAQEPGKVDGEAPEAASTPKAAAAATAAVPHHRQSKRSLPIFSLSWFCLPFISTLLLFSACVHCPVLLRVDDFLQFLWGSPMMVALYNHYEARLWHEEAF